MEGFRDIDQLCGGRAVLVLAGNYSIGLCVREGLATAGVDIAAVGRAPGWEGIGVDICLDDDLALANTTLADLLGLILPLQEGEREFVTIDHQRYAALVVRLLLLDKKLASACGVRTNRRGGSLKCR